MVRESLFAVLLAAAAPAYSQSAEAPLPDPEVGGNSFTVGLGAAVNSQYEGSDDYRFIPAAFIRGKVGNISFTTRGLGLYVDFLSSESNVDFDLGPIVALRLNRTGKIKDDFVDALPERDAAIEVGGFAGVSFKGVTNPYDSLGFRLDVTHDIGGAHGSTIWSPNIDFSTPLSRTFFVSVNGGLDFVGNGYADCYFSIPAADALASGLPVYDADGGMKSWKVGLLANLSLSGDLRRGWSIFGLANHSRLVGDFKDSPIVEDRGSPSQWLGALGVAYSW
ncbi:MipA/OmpV family protein [Sphingomonas mesophila]|uniref:MipA/OmpV family protein n=1 Tax=Sphingomonas mesophila TaxID=2303576 RepID=UPI0013C34969|nr:MipA/OmpV family protein [Sphingomonas mesophila]